MSSRDSAIALPRRWRQAVPAAWVRLYAHPVFVLAVIVGVAVVGWAQFTSATRGWSVMTDELQYVRLAVSIGESWSPVPEINGEFHGSYNQLYPLLLAPLYAWLDMEAAFDAAHPLNTALMVSAAVPAYLLARDVGAGRLAAYVAAALTVAVPWLVFATMILTENAAYPMFLWAVLAMERALARPGVRADLVAVAAVVVAFGARTQFALLVVLLPVAVLLHEAGFAAVGAAAGGRAAAAGGAVRRALREHRALWLAYGVVLAAAAAIALPRGSFAEILGSYAETTEGDLFPAGTLGWMAQHLAVVAVAIGVIPMILAVGWMAAALVRRTTAKPAHAFAVLMPLVAVLLTFQATTFTLRFTEEWVQDRYLFYIAPLLFVGMAVALSERRLPWPAVAAGATAFAAVAWVPSYVREEAAPFFNSPAGVFHSVLDGRAWELGSKLGFADLDAAPVILIGGVVVSVAAAVAIRRLSPVVAAAGVGLALISFSVAETRYVFGAMNDLQAGRPPGTPEHRNWVDRAVPEDASVSVVYTPFGPDPFQTLVRWWETELFNSSIDREFQYHDGAHLYASATPFPWRILAVDWESGLIDHAGVDSEYLLFAGRDPHLLFRPQGEEVAATESGLNLVRLTEPWRAQWATRGVDNDGWVTDTGVLRLYGDGRERRALRVSFTLALATESDGPHRYTVDGGRRRLAGKVGPHETQKVATALCVPARGHSDLKIHVPDKTRLPSGAYVGLNLRNVAVRQAAGGCAGI